MVPAVVLQVTAGLKPPVPATLAEQLVVPLTLMPVGVQVTETEVTTAGTGMKATLADDDCAAFCVEVAVMVTLPDAGAFAGGV